MSHQVKAKGVLSEMTEQHLPDLVKALAALGFTMGKVHDTNSQKFNYWASRTAECCAVIQKKGMKSEAGLVVTKTDNGVRYAVHFDNATLGRELGRNGKMLGRELSLQTSERQLRAKGYRTFEREVRGNEIALKARA